MKIDKFETDEELDKYLEYVVNFYENRVKVVENQQEKIEFDYTKDTKEIKSKRVQLVMTPSMYKALKQRVKAEKTSVNDFVCQFLQKIL